MAIVYLGHDLLLGRDVAIKSPRPQFSADPGFRARFEREARAAASLSHPNIIDVYDVGEDDGTPFIVMELVRGQSLKEIIAADAPFHPDDVAELLEQIGGALDYAHARGYVHRDIKPGNILIDEHGRARLVDFGIAKGLADGDLTEAGVEPRHRRLPLARAGRGSDGHPRLRCLLGRRGRLRDADRRAPLRRRDSRRRGDAPRQRSRAASVTRRAGSAAAGRPHHPPRARQRPDPALGLSRRLRPRAARLAERRSAPAGDASPAGLHLRRAPPARGSLAPTIVVVILVLAALAALLWTGFRNLPDHSRADAFIGPHTAGAGHHRRHRSRRRRTATSSTRRSFPRTNRSPTRRPPPTLEKPCPRLPRSPKPWSSSPISRA